MDFERFPLILACCRLFRRRACVGSLGRAWLKENRLGSGCFRRLAPPGRRPGAVHWWSLSVLARGCPPPWSILLAPRRRF
eukprot:14555496-Alexandrium_andersonii.AAC.1